MSSSPPSTTGCCATLYVLEPGFLTTIQDLGRPGSERFGAPAGGAMDRLALMAANALVGNPPGTAGLEAALLGPVLEVGDAEEGGLLVAVTGRGFRLEIRGRGASRTAQRSVPRRAVRDMPLWMAVWVRRGETITLRGEGGGWGYLAVGGGIAVPEVLGSRSTYLRGGFGGQEGRALQAGDVLPVGIATGSYELAGQELAEALRPPYSDHPLIDVVLGPQESAFIPAAIENLLNEEYALTTDCDRMGYRLGGPPLAHQGAADLLSEGIPLGAVQVPGDGQPIVLMADRQTTGGYPKIAVVTSASLPLLAQCPPGSGSVRFRAVSVAEAQEMWRRVQWTRSAIG